MLCENLHAVFRKYKISEFPYPLYYCLPYGLRFVIGDEVTGAAALSRAEQIFAAAFPKQDNLLVVIEGDVEPISALKKLDYESELIEVFDEDTAELRVITRSVYGAPAHGVPHTVLLDSILKNPDEYGSKIYFVDTDTGMMMMLYDERGADLVAPRPEPLAPIFRDLKPMLSIIDLPDMKLKFEQ